MQLLKTRTSSHLSKFLLGITSALFISGCASQSYVDKQSARIEHKMDRLERTCVTGNELDILLQAGFSGMEDAIVTSYGKLVDDNLATKDLATNAGNTAGEAVNLARKALTRADEQKQLYTKLQQEVTHVQKELSEIEDGLKKEKKMMLSKSAQLKGKGKSKAQMPQGDLMVICSGAPSQVLKRKDHLVAEVAIDSYAFGAWELDRKHRSKVKELVAQFTGGAYQSVYVVGFGDGGDVDPEQTCSVAMKRAKRVTDYLVQQGIAKEKIRVASFGDAISENEMNWLGSSEDEAQTLIQLWN